MNPPGGNKMSSSSSQKRWASVLAVAGMVVLVLALTLSAVACGKASLVGKWFDSADNLSIEFTSDGKVISDEFQGATPDYKAEGGKITITVAGIQAAVLGYTLNGDTLTLTDLDTGEPATFTRVK